MVRARIARVVLVGGLVIGACAVNAPAARAATPGTGTAAAAQVSVRPALAWYFEGGYGSEAACRDIGTKYVSEPGWVDFNCYWNGSYWELWLLEE